MLSTSETTKSFPNHTNHSQLLKNGKITGKKNSKWEIREGRTEFRYKI